MAEWMQWIQELGFPIFVSFYLMHRVETKLVAIHDALLTLKLN
ncbi:YvrJ family protein [Planococcus versutus]|nr:YvrJ family protein [Planococcus versutus]